MSEPAIGTAARGRRAAVRRLASYVGRNKRYYAVWLATTLAYTAGFLAVPWMVGWAFQAHEQNLGSDAIAWRAGMLGLVAVGTAAVRFFSRTLIFNAAREIEFEIRNDLFAHLERLPQSFYFEWRTGDIMSRCVNDVNSVRLLLGVGLLNLVQTPILYFGAIGMMLSIDPTLALLVIVPYPLFIVIARTLGKSIHHWSLQVQEGLAELSNRLQESIAGVAVVKAYAMEAAATQRFDRVNRSLFRRQLGLTRANAAMQPVVSVLPATAMLLLLLIGGQSIATGRLPASDFFRFALLVFQLTFPTFIMGWVVALVQRGAASMQRLDELLSIEPAIADRPDVVDVDELRGEIEFRDLTFRYPGQGREPALQQIRLRVPAGSTLGVVGPVGSGKSTLASIVPRLYEVDDGSVFIDGIDVNRIPLRTLRSGIAMVPQESCVFSVNQAANIAFGLESVDDERVVSAAERSQLAKDLGELPNGYETVVGERGVMLSGGQRQRTALARALVLEPRILILDDTLSAVDAETEAAIQAELDAVFSGRTVIVVSSQVSAVRNADHIVVLDAGRIVESGLHDELLSRGGLYSRLAREQEEDVERIEGAA
jgi:ATP-binding cassette subfamily B multidrug efflux pump